MLKVAEKHSLFAYENFFIIFFSYNFAMFVK